MPVRRIEQFGEIYTEEREVSEERLKELLKATEPGKVVYISKEEIPGDGGNRVEIFYNGKIFSGKC